MAPTNPKELTPLQIWILAARPRTLPAAAAPVIMGSAVAYWENKFALLPALAALLAALLLQIGANLANDVFDYHKGADTAQRLGPLRVTQAGLRSPGQVLRAMWTVFGLAALLGIYLIWVAGWPVLAIGAASILAAMAYTGGPFPFGYYGLGEVFVFLFFGIAAEAGSYFVQARQVSPLAWWASVPVGLLITAILVVNNLRDIETDRAAGKRTLAVRLGAAGARREYVLCLAGAYLAPPFFWIFKIAPPWVLLAWLTLPLAFRLVQTVYRVTGRPLNKALGGTGQLTLFYALAFSLGLIIAS